ncbi:MAG: phage tail tape measure protein, partial [Erythrobacter sp.]
ATQAVVEQTSATEISIRATLSLAEAYLESTEAAARAEARRQGLVDQAREGVNAETRARQALRERIAEQAVEAARQVSELGRQIDGQRRLNEAISSGALSSQRAQQIMQVEQALRPLITAQTLAEGEAKEKLGRIIDRTREAYEQLHREQNRTDLLQGIERRRDEIALRERELSLVRRGPAARREGVDQLRFEQELKRLGIDPNDPEANYSREQIRRLNQLGRQTTGREAAFDYEQQNTCLAREVELLKQGASARSEAIAMIRAEQQLRRQGIDPAGAEGQAALAAARRQFALERQAEAQVALQDQRAEIALIETQIGLIGASAQQRETVLATIRAEQDLRRRGIDLASEEGRAIVANAVRVQQLTTELQRQEATQRALQGAIGNALDRFGALLAQGKTDWKSWADAGQAAINDIMNELIKLAVMNPLKNFLFGGNAPTLATGGGIFGELGKIFAVLFHEGGLVGAGGPGRNVPTLLFAGAPRLHGGGYIRPGEVPAILQTGERVLNRKETAAYDQRGEQTAPMMVTFNITTPDVGSFRRAQGQITAEMASALERARRNL